MVNGIKRQVLLFGKHSTKVVWEELFQIEGQLPSVYCERYLGARCCTSLKLALNTRHPVHSISLTTPSDIPCTVP